MGASALVAVATLELCRQVMVKRRAIFIAIAGAIAALSVAGSIASIPVARALKRERTRASACLEVERYIDPATDKYEQSCLFPLFPLVPFTGRIRGGAEKLDALGFRKIVRHVAFIENPTKPYGTFELSTKDGEPPTVRDGEAVEARGWASVPGGDRPARIVLVSVGDARVFITAAWVKAHARRDRTQARQPDQVAQPEWSVSIPAVFLPAGESVLKAWVYDSEEQEFVRLGDLKGENRVYKVP